MAVAEDAVWSAESTTPDEIEAALRRLLRGSPRPGRPGGAGAGAEHDRVRGPRLDGRDRQPPARGRALPRLAHAGAVLRAPPPHPRRARHDLDRLLLHARGAVAAARDRGGGTGRSPPRRPAHDRRPAGGDRSADAAVVTPRPPRGDLRAAAPLAGGAARLGRGARPGRGPAVGQPAGRAGLRRGPRVAAQHAVARARGGDLRPADAGARNCARSPPSRSATTPPRPPPRCCSRAGWRRAWAGAKPRCWPTAGRCGAAPTPTARTSPCTCRRPPS